MQHYISPIHRKDVTAFSVGRNITNTSASYNNIEIIPTSLSPRDFENKLQLSRIENTNNEDKVGLRHEIKEHIVALKHMKKELKKQQNLLKTCATECIDNNNTTQGKIVPRLSETRGRIAPITIDQENLNPLSMITPQNVNKRVITSKSNEQKKGFKPVTYLNLRKVHEMRKSHNFERLSSDNTQKMVHTKGSSSYRDLEKADTEARPYEKEALYQEILHKIKRENDSLKKQIENYIDTEKYQLSSGKKSPSNDLHYSSDSKRTTTNPTNRLTEQVIPFELEESLKRSSFSEDTPKGEERSELIQRIGRNFEMDDTDRVTEVPTISRYQQETVKRAVPLLPKINQFNYAKIPLSDSTDLRMDTPITLESTPHIISHSGRMGERDTKNITPSIDEISHIKPTSNRPEENSILRMLSNTSFEQERHELRRLREEVDQLNEQQKTLLTQLSTLKETEIQDKAILQNKEREIETLNFQLQESKQREELKASYGSPGKEVDHNEEDLITKYERELKEMRENLGKIEQEKESIINTLKIQEENKTKVFEEQLKEKDETIERLQHELNAENTSQDEKEIEKWKEDLIQQELESLKTSFTEIEKSLKAEIEDLQGKLFLSEQTKAELQTYQAQVVSLNSEIVSLKQREAEFEAIKRENDSNIKKIEELTTILAQEKSITENKNNELVEAKSTFEEELTGMRKELDEEKNRTDALTRSFSQKIEDLQTKLSESDNERQLIRTNTIELDEALKGKSEEVDVLRGEITQLNQEISEFKRQISTAEETHKSTLEEKTKLIEKVQSLEQSLKTLEQVKSEKEKEVATLQQEKASHIEENNRLKEELRNKPDLSSELENTRNQVSSLEKQLSQAKAEKAAEEKLKEKIIQEKKAVEKGVSKKQQQVDDLQREVDRLKDESNKLTQNLSSAETESEKLTQRNSELLSTIKKLEEKAKGLSKIGELEQILTEKESSLKNSESKIEELEKISEELKQEIALKNKANKFSIFNLFLVVILMAGALGLGTFHCDAISKFSTSVIEQAKF